MNTALIVLLAIIVLELAVIKYGIGAILELFGGDDDDKLL